MHFIRKRLILACWALCLVLPLPAQFIDNFESGTNSKDHRWQKASGDGDVALDFQIKEGYASFKVDATADRQNIWWAVIRHPLPEINVRKLMKPGYELRVEARIRVSHAPRRVNLHLNHQRTTDFHSHLMEFDIPDTLNWHTISLTTTNFEAQPGDLINVQMALMDWGLHEYRVDIDYIKVDVVKRSQVGADLGSQLPYHPPLPEAISFAEAINVYQDATIDLDYPELNFNNWISGNDSAQILAVSGTQIALLRWELSPFRNRQPAASGLMELTMHSWQRSTDFDKDFGMIRIMEIIGGDPHWDQQRVSLANLLQGRPMDQVINEQMIIDSKIIINEENKAYFTISYPVLQRLMEGKTLGLAIRSLGAVNATFYASENANDNSARLLFDLKPELNSGKD